MKRQTRPRPTRDESPRRRACHWAAAAEAPDQTDSSWWTMTMTAMLMMKLLATVRPQSARGPHTAQLPCGRQRRRCECVARRSIARRDDQSVPRAKAVSIARPRAERARPQSDQAGWLDIVSTMRRQKSSG